MPGSSQENLNSKSINFCIYHFCLYFLVPSLCCKAAVTPEDGKPETHPVLPYLKAVKSGCGDHGSDSGGTEGLICSDGHPWPSFSCKGRFLFKKVFGFIRVPSLSTSCITAQLAWIQTLPSVGESLSLFWASFGTKWSQPPTPGLLLVTTDLVKSFIVGSRWVEQILKLTSHLCVRDSWSRLSFGQIIQAEWNIFN